MSRDERKNAKVISSALGRTSGGKDQLCITFECEGGERLSYYQLFETDGNMEHAERTLKTLGWDPLANGWAVDRLHQTPVLVGREASLVIEEAQKMGKDPITGIFDVPQFNDNGEPIMTRRVKFVNDAKGGAGMRDVMSPQDAATFSARLRARMQGQPAPAARPSQSAPAARPTVVTQRTFAGAPAAEQDGDEDVPF